MSADISLKEKVKWNIRLAARLDSLKLHALALEVYDSVYSQGIALNDSAGREDAKRSCYSKGIIFLRLSKYNPAQSEFEKYFSSNPQMTVLKTDMDMNAAGSMADICLRLGDNKKAGYYYSWGFRANSKKPPNQQFPGCYNDMVVYYNTIKEYDSARWFAEKGMLLPDTNLHYKNVSLYKSLILSNLANTLLATQQFEQAEKSAVAYLNLVDTLDDTYFQMRATYADALKASSKFPLAIGQYDQAVLEGIASRGSDKSREFSKLYKSFGDCYQKMGMPDSALFYYHKALGSVIKIDSGLYSIPGENDLYAENAIQEALDAEADWWMNTNQPPGLKNALKALELAMKVDDLLQQQFSFDISKLDYQRQKKSRSCLAIGICFQLFKKEHNQEWVTRAWLFSEAAKAAVLMDDIKQQVNYEQNAGDTLVQQMKELEQEQADLKKDMFVTPDTAILFQQLKESYAATEDKYIRIARDLKLKSPAFGKLHSAPAKTDFLHHPLFENTPVVEFFAPDSSHYYIFSKDEKGRMDLDTCSLPYSFLLDWLDFFSKPENCSNHPKEFKQAGYTIYSKLLGPVIENKGYSALVIIPDGLLGYLPWDALVTGPGVSNSWQQTAFLLKSVSVTLGFSLENLIQQSERKQTVPSHSVVGFAPGFMKGERGLSPLKASLEELNAIETAQPGGKYFTGPAATTANYKKMAGDAGMLHISSHASSGSSEDSCKLQFYDAALYMHELSLQPVNARAVILSACETGLGKIENGEGVFNMARSFYYAGAKNVITSLWKVDDVLTADLFKIFYQQKGEPFSMLHHAKLQYLEGHSRDYASPYYWAAFSNTGYTSIIKSNSNAWWTAIITVIFLAAILVFSKKTKQAI